jgi:hypothetical protein
MRSSRLLIPLLVAANVAASVAVLVAWDRRSAESVRYLVLGLTLSQPSLLAIWVAMGRKGSLWRYSALLAVIVGWSVAWEAKVGPHLSVKGIFLVQIGILLLSEAVFTFGAVSLARLAGACVSATNSPAAVDPAGFQFTLRQLLVLTTVLAIAMGLIRWLVPVEALRGALRYLHLLVGISGAAAAIALAALWAALGIGWPALRLLTLLLMVVGATTGFACLNSQIEIDESLPWFGPQALLVYASLLVVRAAGYRLTWQRRRRAVAGPPDG